MTFIQLFARLGWWAITIFHLQRGHKMSEIDISECMLKRALKEALVEVLEERRAYLCDMIEEVLEDFEMVEDIREVKHVESARRGLFAINKGEA